MPGTRNSMSHMFAGVFSVWGWKVRIWTTPMAPHHANPFVLLNDNLPTLVPRFLPPTNSSNLQSHIQVYAIPYGVLGVVSHALTFYVIFCHMLGRCPLLPWQPLKKTTWNICIVSLSSLVSVILSAVTMARSRGSQPLMILAGMQIVLGVLVDAVHVHRLIIDTDEWSNSLGLWGVPMVLTGVFSIWAFYQFPHTEESGNIGNVLKSIAFLVLLAWLGLTGLVTAFNFIWTAVSLFKNSIIFAVPAILFSCALFWFGDFGIATVSKNTIGTPSKQVTALYYSFWLVEKLPLFTF
ncbi:hypothetical protein C7974DRAFT_387049 [Boeremia exigua]|uniref:uncharacterized protein n=1 Tax=Boeremia exigua TaxID=749465 RepID=UPI001E8D4B31|nr:uncharacterized protein C7974DRAFT_387049 [Boeremia exigua]KAH6643215.1 hypothetical protein C7974DRAFT_387049 [Boeremia exigua]